MSQFIQVWGSHHRLKQRLVYLTVPDAFSRKISALRWCTDAIVAPADGIR
jgi:hypothetical protein